MVIQTQIKISCTAKNEIVVRYHHKTVRQEHTSEMEDAIKYGSTLLSEVKPRTIHKIVSGTITLNDKKTIFWQKYEDIIEVQI